MFVVNTRTCTGCVADHFSTLRRRQQGIVGDSVVGKAPIGEDDTIVHCVCECANVMSIYCET